MENVNVMTAVSDTAVESTKPKHKWLAKGSRFAKKAILTATVMSSMAAMCTTQAFAATGEVDTSSFLFSFPIRLYILIIRLSSKNIPNITKKYI